MSSRSGSLRFGRPMVAIPGPSVVPDRVMAAMQRPMPDIYSGELVEMGWGLLDELPALARTSGHAFVLVGNGHGAWQMALCNTLSRGETVLVLDSGRFAAVWGEMAAGSGLEVEVLAGRERRPIDPGALHDRLAADTGHRIAAILAVHVDTATSVRNDLPALRAAIDEAGHPALLMADCIASLGCEPYEMDAWGVDVTVGASQKGLMMPPGLAFVWANRRAVAASEFADRRVPYLDWAPRMQPDAFYQLFGGTPPIPALFAMREALDMLREEGLENAWARHEVLADSVRTAVGAWSVPGGLELNIVDPAARANSVTTIRSGSVDPDELRAVCADRAGLTLGLGIGLRGFRIGHMGHLNPPMVLGCLGTVEAGLRAIGAPIGASGAAAAAAVVADALA